MMQTDPIMHHTDIIKRYFLTPLKKSSLAATEDFIRVFPQALLVMSNSISAYNVAAGVLLEVEVLLQCLLM